MSTTGVSASTLAGVPLLAGRGRGGARGPRGGRPPAAARSPASGSSAKETTPTTSTSSCAGACGPWPASTRTGGRYASSGRGGDRRARAADRLLAVGVRPGGPRLDAPAARPRAVRRADGARSALRRRGRPRAGGATPGKRRPGRTADRARRSSPSTARPGRPTGAVASSLARALSSVRLRRAAGADAAGTSAVERAEDENAHVLLVDEAGAGVWSDLCARQADRTLLVATADSPAPGGLHPTPTS